MDSLGYLSGKIGEGILRKLDPFATYARLVGLECLDKAFVVEPMAIFLVEPGNAVVAETDDFGRAVKSQAKIVIDHHIVRTDRLANLGIFLGISPDKCRIPRAGLGIGRLAVCTDGCPETIFVQTGRTLDIVWMPQGKVLIGDYDAQFSSSEAGAKYPPFPSARSQTSSQAFGYLRNPSINSLSIRSDR